MHMNFINSISENRRQLFNSLLGHESALVVPCIFLKALRTMGKIMTVEVRFLNI